MRKFIQKLKMLKLYKKLFFIFPFALACMCLLGSWSNDNDGNLVSDNLYSGDRNVSVRYENGSYYKTITFNSIDVADDLFIYFNLTSDSDYWGIYVYNNDTFISYIAYDDYISYPNGSTDNILSYVIYEGSGVVINRIDFYCDIYEENTTRTATYQDIMISTKPYLVDYEPYNVTYYSSENYNSLYENYITLSDDYDELLQVYNVLLPQYNTLNQAYQDLYNSINILESIYNNANAYLFSFNSATSLYSYATQTTNYLAVDNDFHVPRSDHIAVSDFTNIYDYLDEAENNGNSIIWSIRLANVTNMPLNINFINNEVYNVYLVNTYNNELNSFDVINNALSINNQQEYTYNVVLIKVYQKSWTWDTLSTNNYNLLYNQGYAQATYELNIQIAELNTIIQQKNNQIRDLTEQANNGVGWRSFFFAMADTPLKVVSSVLGFELFGVNLFHAFIGIITVLAIIWLIRILIKK